MKTNPTALHTFCLRFLSDRAASAALAAVLLLAALPEALLAFAPTVTKLHGRSTTPQANNNFGLATAVSDAFLLVGEPDNGDVAYKAGAAHVYDARNGRYLRKLTAADGAAYDQFGYSVALSGHLALVGAYAGNGLAVDSGSAYVFDLRTGRQLFKLIAADGAAYDQFGCSVALSGNLALVGANRDDDLGNDSGSAYVFDTRTGAQLDKLKAADGAASDNFGKSVALSGHLALLGANGDADLGSKSGSAYVFDARTGAQLDKLKAADGAAGDNFGYSVALSGHLALVGAFGDEDLGSNSGSAYVFDTRTGAQLAKLNAADGVAADSFGSSVALNGHLALVGANGDADLGSQSGSAYVFDVRTGMQLAKLTAADGAAGDKFGASVALSVNLALVGALGDDDLDPGSGAAYFFREIAGPLPLTAVAQTRDFAPGAVGGVFRSFGDAVINTQGETAFDARLTGAGGGTAARGVWSTAGPLGTHDLVARGGTDLSGGMLANAVMKPVFNHVSNMIFQGTVKGAGVNAGNNTALFHSYNGGTPSPFLREGGTHAAFNGAVLNRFHDVVQSYGGTAADAAVAFQFKSGPGGVNSGSDSGILAVKYNGTLVDVVSENSGLASLPGVLWGQFTPRASMTFQKMTWSAFIKGAGVTTANNQGLFQIQPGAPQEALVARKGAAVAGGFIRSFLGEGINVLSDEVVYRASLGGVPASRNEILRYKAVDVWTKGDLVDGFDPTIQPGARLVRLLKFWPVYNNKVLFLARMAGPGVNASNDTALWLWDNRNGQGANTIQMLLREGDDAGADDGARIHTIQRVDVDSLLGQYVVLAALTGPAAANQGLFAGGADFGNKTIKRALRLPALKLRKGTRYQAALGETTQIRSLSLTETTDRSGVGAKGGGQVVNVYGEVAISILFTNGFRVLMSGQP